MKRRLGLGRDLLISASRIMGELGMEFFEIIEGSKLNHVVYFIVRSGQYNQIPSPSLQRCVSICSQQGWNSCNAKKSGN